MEKLLSRDQFRNGVFERDNHQCVICKHPIGLDAHHIIERRLFTAPEEAGGYFISNGATLCSVHHIKAEETTLSCEEIRIAAGIEKIIIPEHLYHDLIYDKWGNIIMLNGKRLKGELFNDESVQKILQQGGVLNDFSKYIKYQRTYHLPWSTLGKDDRMLQGDELEGKDIVATLKLDGENTTMYNDYIHARSVDSDSHPTRNWVKGLWAQMGYMLDEDMRVCGENLYAQHTIHYNNLKSYFYAFSIWEGLTCLSWQETLDFAGILGLETVPVIYEGLYNPKLIQEAFKPYEKDHEGYVVRNSQSFHYGQFRKNVGKFVLPQFKQALNNSHGHWISQKIIPNQLLK